jgi:glucose/arabinose dehydrogenase
VIQSKAFFGRQRSGVLAVLILAGVFAGCDGSSSKNGGGGGGGNGGGGNGGGGSVETPVLGLQRIGAAPDGSPHSFAFPVMLAAPRGETERQFIVEKAGRILVVRHNAVLVTPFLDLSAQVMSGEEEGLLGLAFDPGYAGNGRFYVHYSDFLGRSVISRFEVSDDPDVADPGSERVLLEIEQPDPYHNGGMLAFGPDGMLYIALGDGNWGDGSGDPAGHAQDKATLLGSMLRIDVSGDDYAVPADNPFVGEAGSRPEIWAFGFRNPWRFSFDGETGDLYIGDVGHEPPTAREEINFAAAPAAAKGQNFGWNRFEGNECFNAALGCDDTGLTPPLVEYGHPAGEGGICSASVTGGYAYRGTDIPGLAGTYFYSDFCVSWVRSFRQAGGAATQAMEWDELRPGGGNVVSFGEDGRGDVYLLTMQGAIYRIVLGAVGAAGGVVRSPDGLAAVSVPQGSLAASVPITVKATEDQPSGQIGLAYTFAPEGTAFTVPATITIAYDPGELPFGVDESQQTLGRLDGDNWVPVPGASVDTVARHVSGPVTGFSSFARIRLGAGPPPGSATLTIQLSGLSDDGLVSSDIEGVWCHSIVGGPDDGPCEFDLPAGTTVTLTADPYPQPTPPITWTGCDQVDGADCIVTLNGNRTVSVQW